ncbi:MAG: TIGR01777 family oxidoreductase [Nocardioides sp.]|uniref:TIGR01777 family oxidoreductase n=1 Tax=Nocardioides sp. TaxID=35761 RepID=UPI003F0644AB
MHVVMAGASGFLGTHLTAHLRAHGHTVTHLVRRGSTSPNESAWDPYAGQVDRDLVASSDVVVNLAGVNVAGNPHSRSWASRVMSSRVVTTALLAEAIAEADRPPAYIAGNGISFYGDHGDAPLTEESESRGDALLTRVTREWQAATEPARAAGARVCVLRTAPVLDRSTAPLKPMIPLFSAGLGTRMGDGRQYFPVISLRDWVGAAAFLLESRDVAGVFNLCCPTTPTNAEYTEALASVLGRKAFLAAPAPVLRVAAGRMAPEILGSLNARPAALERAGFDFQDQDVHEVLAAALA